METNIMSKTVTETNQTVAQEVSTTTSKVTTTGAAATAPAVKKNGPKNWDKIVKDFEEEEKEELKTHPDTNPNKLFEMMYKSGDDDTKRAMMKSMYESNGTSLIMDWNKAKHPIKPYDDKELDDSDDSDKESDD